MPPRQFRPRPCAGFSLIELLITFALMAVMVSMLYGFGSARHQKTQKQLCADNLQKMFLAAQIYANDFHGQFPFITNAVISEDALGVLVPKYSTDTSIFICPGGRDSQIPSGEPLAARKISYAYFMGHRDDSSQKILFSDRLVDTLPKQTGEKVFSTDGKSPGNNHHKYGGNFLLGDGSVSGSKALLELPAFDTNGIILLNPKP
jgi:prepilin-type N-terminal cleavage/methylation domain-containing protein